MAYSGTGTEADPYLVSTLDDFMRCAKITNAYVKVVSNIDGRIEEEYPIYPYIQVNAKKIYADALTKVSGFIVKDTYCFNISSNCELINNIDFDDILFTPNYNGPTVIAGSSTATCVLSSCKISINTNYDNQNVAGIFAAVTFNECALFLSFTGDSIYANSNDSLFNGGTKFHNSIVEIVDYPLTSTTNNVLASTIDHNVFKISFKTYSTSTFSITIGGSSAHDNIFVISQRLSDEYSGRRGAIRIDGTFELVDSDVDVNNDVSFISSGNRCYKLTTQQIQSEEYLSQIGFIP